ncbi:serine/threonine-protein kinase [Actinoplanes sp. NPDC026619]|uniref:serine/threonine-protein kinase n=1 Tax=Actinoplanes sp. NPDC026619 TaxID=3155798 RepID=UPI0033CF880E
MTVAPVYVHDRYRLGRTLGAGGMGRVWQARDELLDRDVALKEILLPDALVEADREALNHYMLREGRAAARLSHPAVARIYDTFESDGRAWIVMEYVPSRSLQEVLDTDGPLPPRRVAEIGLAVLAALISAHAAGVRHRDVKPANVLLATDGRVVLTDFGVAAVDGESLITSSGLVMGSPQYMAPERVRDGDTTAASDLWSLGATLYAAVEGHAPYLGHTVMETITAVVSQPPAPATRAGELGPVLDGLLRKLPAERADAEQTEELLLAALEAPSPPAAAPRRRRTPLIAAGVAVLLLAAAVISWVLLRPEVDRTTATPQPSTPITPSAAVPSAAVSSAPASPATTTAVPADTRPVLPAGWTDYRDPTGFSVYVPKGWTRSKEGSIVYFRTEGRVLGIDQTDSPQWDPVADWRGKASYRVSHGDFPGYREIRIREVKYFLKAADWEFTFNRSGVRQHVNNRGVVTSKHQAYGFYWQTTDAAWPSAQGDLKLVFDSFRPAAD